MREPPAGACLLLFGTTAVPRGLDALRLRAAYRRMAMLTHPDARRRGADGRDFIRVQEAYQALRACIAEPARSGTTRPAARAEPPSRARTEGRRPGAWYWTGRVPRRRLRLGEYLFFTGEISWETLIGAIVAQRRSVSAKLIGRHLVQLGSLGFPELTRALTGLREHNRQAACSA